MKQYRRNWKIWALVAVIVVFALDIAAHLLNFPVRVAMLQAGVWLTEPFWLKLRI